MTSKAGLQDVYAYHLAVIAAFHTCTAPTLQSSGKKQAGQNSILNQMDCIVNRVMFVTFYGYDWGHAS